MEALLIGLVPALGWGLQVLSMQKVGGITQNKLMGVVTATLIFAIVVWLFGEPIIWSPTLIAAALINGICWTVAQFLQVRSFELIGVSKAFPIVTGLTLACNTLLGVLFFKDWIASWQFMCGVPALLLLVVGVWLTTFTEKKEEVHGDTKLGMICVVLSSLTYIAYASIGKFFTVDGWQMVVPQSIVMFVATLILCVLTMGKSVGDKDTGVFGKKTFANLLSGLFFAIANFTLLISIQMNGLAVGWTLSQMAVVVATLGALLFLKEKKTRKELIYVLSGVGCVVIGGLMVGATKM
ncbi:glucose transporter GlcU [Bartonella sp. W8125]|uniref:GRP family sugar transporter n=1 Tax=Bartonella TaxID=773 RepID=UPI0018DECD77|nr:GRP family sugar transporter [Bartonella choladocola]MBI0139893.1 glucose transporter GlcU [Bartonella choladocola]